MTPEQLKSSILQYAVEGKLVKQNPDDEPASELLKKIEDEKVKLIKAGKIKRNKKLPVVTDEEKSFAIPNNWQWVRLGELLKPEISLKPKSSFKYIDIASLDNKINVITNYKTCIIGKDKIPVRATKLVSKGDILYSTVRPYLKNVAIVPNELDKQIATSGFYVLKSLEPTDNKYLFYLLLSPYLTNAMHEKMKGINSPSIKKSDLKSFPIPLPPLEEQKRIVAKIEKLMSLVDEYAESYNRLQKIDNEFEDKLKQSVLQYAMEGKLVKQNPSDEPASELIKKIENEKAELVKEGKIKKSKKLPAITDEEKPFDIPDSWEWVRLGIISEVRGGKRVPRGMKLSETSSYCPYIRVTDMENNSVAQETLRYATKKIYEEISRYIITSEDVYFSIAGTIGKVGIVPCNLSGALLTENAARLTPYYINKKFMVYLLSSPIVKNQHRKILSKVAQPKLSLIKLKRTIVPLPPLEEQKRIVLKINKLQEVISGLFK
ncbi:restriction endonuclease subunit S [Lactobacillus amylovorus]|uniref:restriction endonuclease subunit S n=1 Tax=Lactobacillus amylovorus TaxID=1604 RepID=UPI00232AF069|nr:restriction endonuclease subunit S [Lactobacillus amylovorus]MDB6224742.1 restriction endonuclease subunit S [Lactobacillus amylovorus]